MKNDLIELKENYDALDGFNDVLKYDLTTSRDSVLLLRKKIETLDLK